MAAYRDQPQPVIGDFRCVLALPLLPGQQLTPAAVSFELNKHHPALLIVAFGTNEGFDDGLDLDRYAARFRADVEALRRAADADSSFRRALEAKRRRIDAVAQA